MGPAASDGRERGLLRVPIRRVVAYEPSSSRTQVLTRARLAKTRRRRGVQALKAHEGRAPPARGREAVTPRTARRDQSGSAAEGVAPQPGPVPRLPVLAAIIRLAAVPAKDGVRRRARATPGAADLMAPSA